MTSVLETGTSPETLQSSPLTVSQLTHSIKKNLEARFSQIYLEGEVSNFKKQSSGHLYFSLKDSQSQISAVMFRGQAMSLKSLPKEGDKVVVRGEINVYPPRGNYQIIVRSLQMVGIGQLLAKLEELKAKLKERGWFSKKYKKALPKFPKRIGVVTSPTGAAIQDILNILKRRHSGFKLLLNPVKVQGEGSAYEIAQAIQQMNRLELCDVLIVGRGGGSIEDLWAFNEEVVAAAIFASKIPVISAVGHEIDTTLADFVADVRAPTPSAAAEIVTAEKEQLLENLNRYSRGIDQWMSQRLQFYQQRLDDFSDKLLQNMKHRVQLVRNKVLSKQKLIEALNPTTQIQQRRQKLQWIEATLQRTVRQVLTRKGKQLRSEDFYRQLETGLNRSWKEHSQKLRKIKEHLDSIHPKHLLRKGYSILFDEKKDSVMISKDQLCENQKIKVFNGRWSYHHYPKGGQAPWNRRHKRPQITHNLPLKLPTQTWKTS